MSLSTGIAIATLRTRKLSRAVRHRSYLRALRRGVLASTENEDAKLSRGFATVLDVGANRGQFAVFARQNWPGARLVCFEPLAEAACRIREVVDGPVEVHEVGVGAAPAVSTLHIAGRDDSSSLREIGRQAEEFPGTASTGSREVPVVTLADHLDDDVARPVLLKIDAQGCEMDVLRGAGDGLDRVDEILCECSFVELYTGQALAGAIVAHLVERGFVLAHVSGMLLSAAGRPLQAEFTFRRAVMA
ncbi:FkbM family methyltransferase [Actinomycetospora aeridis]|uniref:FkbM family methyltransferase n=1 Tax=Actinomycetospora aeridis TaxID=3129231 RepID=A0ABU8N6A5_9PSEU